ncbi:acetyl-CoA carboxylase biotin carboxylase subunit family protein [Mesorhizobium sp. M0862]|uniref:ATP-grasp domain-containing protein n=1 Tax=Mesorhizobium sp. M0862 TaxID=2957015 RepID=UPI00333592DA
MTRRALILVEGHSRIGLLYMKAAKRLGLHPITLSSDPSRHDYLAAETIEAIRIDTDDPEALIRECSRLRAMYDIAGITGFSGDDESTYATVGKLCRHFDLPGPNPASVQRCCNKFTQRQLLANAGLPMPAYRLAANAAEVESAAAQIGLPVVLKPLQGSGSIGVRLCGNVDELAEHAAYLLGEKHACPSSPQILVEEFIQGQHYSADIMGNEVIGIEAAEFGPPPNFIFREYTHPAPLTDEEYKRIADISLSCLQALGLGWGPSFVESRWTNRGPVVIEVNPRIGGGANPQLVQLAYGVDLVTEHIKLVVGDEPDLRKRRSHAAGARFLIADRDGTLDWIRGDSQAAALPGVAEVELYAKATTPIVRKGDHRDRIGHIIAASPNRASVAAILERAVDLVSWSITPFPTPSGREQTEDSHPPAEVTLGNR